jgi:hypothetical protein
MLKEEGTKIKFIEIFYPHFFKNSQEDFGGKRRYAQTKRGSVQQESLSI